MKIFSVEIMKAYVVEVLLPVFLGSSLDRNELRDSHPGHLTAEE
jgi:hypothetical protein